MNIEFKSQLKVFSTCENIGEIFETLRQRLHRNCRARQIGHVGVTFPIGRLGVKILKSRGFERMSLSGNIHPIGSYEKNMHTYFGN